MANDSHKTAPPATDAYIGSLISLISKYEMRYEGVLYHLSPPDSTLGLRNVRSYGTEGRKKDSPQVLPSEKVYEYIIFRGSDIKDLQVKTSPPAQEDEAISDDPAIIQSHCAGGPSKSSKPLPVGGFPTDSGAYQDLSSLSTQPNSRVLVPQQSGIQLGPWSHQTTQNSNTSSYALPVGWQGYSGMTRNTSQLSTQSTNISLPKIENLFQASPTLLSTPTNLTHPSNSPASGPMVTTLNSTSFNVNSILPSGHLSTSSSDLPSLLVNSPLPSYPELISGSRLSPSLVSSSSQNKSSIEAPYFNQVGSGPVSVLTGQSSYPVTSSGLFSNQLPKLLTPDQLSQPRPSELPSSQKMYPVQKVVGVLSSTSSNSSSSITSPAVQAPLLPLPPPAQKLHYSPSFSEEFDFEAMNEKFKKDEIWGYLGKAKQGITNEETEDNVNAGQKLGDDAFVTKVDDKPAYNKDEFFDSISCHSLSRGARDGCRFSERMKLDTETFGTLQHRVHPGYAFHRAAHGRNVWGRGQHHYGARGRGGYMRT